jgi:hypothetical protein
MNRWLRFVCSVLAVSSMALPAFAGDVPASGTKAGSVTALLPTAHLSRTVNSKDVTKDAAKGDDVLWQDTIRTEKGGRARITLTDQSILSVGSQAELKVIKHDAKTQQTQLELTYGKIRAEVTTVTKDGGGFEVKTPTAVAGVIGTVFGMDSSPVETSFLCMSGLVNIRSTDPSIGGTTSCEAGKVVVMGAGKAPVKRNATPEEYQKFFSDTETATITGMWPWAGLPGSTIEAKANGTHLDGVTSVTSSDPAIGVTLKPASDLKGTSLNLHLTVAENTKPGAYVLTFKKPGGAQTAAVFLALGPPGGLDDIDSLLNSYLESIEEERHAALGALNAVQSQLTQAADMATGQLSAANAAAKPPLDLTKTGGSIQDQAAALQTDLASSQTQVNAASDAAKKDFTTRFNSAVTALKARNANGKPDAQFRSSLASAFTDVNSTLTKTVGGMVDSLSEQAATLEAAITALENTEMAAISKATPGGTIAGQAVEQGFVANFDAGTLGSVTPLKWSVCDTTYKPSSFNVALPPNAPGCAALPGYTSNAAAFAVNSCDLKPANYAVRFTNGNNSYDTSLKIIAPAYDDPVSRLQGLALAYSALTPDVFMEYFDQVNFPGYSRLAENIRRTMETLDTMSIRIIVDDVSINCNEATIRSEWQENYSFHQSPNHIQHLTPQQMTVKLSRTPGKGWFITALNGDNGTVQGLPVGPVLTDAPAPQLAVLDVSVTAVVPAPVRASTATATTIPVVPLGPVKFSATVSNTGSADVNLPLEVEFFLLDGKGNQIDTETTVLQPPLVAGKTNTVQGILNIPTTVPGGSLLQVGVRVNPGCKVQVTLCDASNLTTLQVQVGAVDLAVKTIAAAAQLVGTLAGSIDVTIDNVGKQASTATTGNLLLTSPVFAGTLKGNIPSIPAGGSTVVSFPLAALPNISGARNFTATINPVPTGDINTADKTLTTALSILTAVDMQVVSIASVAQVVEGQPETFNVTLKNLGGATSTASTGNLQFLVGTTLLAAGDTPAVSPGSTVVVPVAVTLPVAVGSRNFTAKLGPAVALDTNAANDALTTPFTLAPAVDIQVVSIGSTGSLVEAQPGTVTVTLQNNGAITSTATTGNLKLSGPSGALGTANIPAIAAGATATISFGVTVPTAAGSTSFSAQITPKVPLDLDAANDTLTQSLVVLSAVDIQVVSIGSSGSLIEAQPGTITVTLKNLGAGTSTATTGNLNVNGTSGALASANIPAIGPGATTVVSVPVTVPTVTGNSAFVAQISPAVPLDVTSANDTLSQNLPVLAAVDIRVVSITNSGGSLVDGQAASFTVTLKNNGAVTSSATTGNLLLSGPSGGPLATANIPAIAAGANTAIVMGVTLPAVSGSNNFTAAINPAVPLDLNSANDSLTTAFNITGNFVDLKVTAFTLRQTTGLLSGNSYGFSMSVQNNGNVSSSASDTLSCVATGPNFSGSVSLPLTTASLAPIAPGATSSFGDTLSLPKNLAGADTFACTAGGDPNEAAGTLADNSASSTAGVNYNVNLRFSGTQAIPAALQMGSSVTFNATVTNDGPDDAPANYSLQSMLNSVVSGTIAGVALPALGTHTFAVPILVPQIGTAPQDVTGVAGQVSILDGTGFTETNATDNVFSNSTFRLLDFQIATSKTTMLAVNGRTLDGTAYTVFPATYTSLIPGLTVTPTGLPAGVSMTNAGVLSGTVTTSPGPASATFSGSSKGITHAATAALPFNVRAEIKFTESSTPSILQGGASGTLAGTLTGGVGNLSAALPASAPTGITITGASPQTVAAGGTVTWSLQASTAAALGSQILNLTGTDNGIANTFETVPAGNVALSGAYSVSTSPLPNFVITTAQFVNHGAPPYIGATALQLGEAAQMTVVVKNTGTANPATGATVQVAMACAACGVAGTSGTVTAPNAGATASLTFSVGTVADTPATSYAGTATVSASVGELSTTDNSKSVSWDETDFTVVESAGWPSTQNMHVAVASNIGFNVTEAGGTPAFAIPITVTSGVSGIGVPAKASFAPAATDYTANITVPLSTAPGSDTITFTGTNYGVSHSFTQNVNYYTAGLVSTTLFTNSSSQPLKVPVNNGAGVTLELQMQGNYITPSGSSGATLSLDNTAAPFMTFHSGATTALPGDNIGVVVADPTTSTLLAPGAFKINSVIPATIPQDTLTYFLWVMPVGTSQLAITTVALDASVATPISSLAPWVSGETLPFDFTVTNNGTAKSAGGELLEVYFNNTSTGNIRLTQTTTIPSLGPGASTVIVLNLTAPDGNLAATTTVEPHIHQDPPNTSTGVTISSGWNTSDWTLVIGNPGNADATPVTLTQNPASGQYQGTAAFGLTIPNGGRGAQFRTTPTVASGITPNAKYFSQSLSQTGTTGQALETLLSLGAANDFYLSQVTASIGKVTRQGTIHIQNTVGTAAQTVVMSSTDNNVAPIGNTPPASVQINGYVIESLDLTGKRSGGAADCVAGVQNNCNFFLSLTPDPSASGYGANGEGASMSYGTPTTYQFTAALNPATGALTTGNATVTASVTGAQTNGTKLGQPKMDTNPQPVGTQQFGLAFTVADLAVTFPTCVSVPPGTSLAVPLAWTPINGYNAPSVNFKWIDAGSAVVASSIISPNSGSATPKGSTSFTVTNATGSNPTAVTYTLEVTLLNSLGQPGPVDKFIPVTFDLTAAGGYCGASTPTGTHMKQLATSGGAKQSKVAQMPATLMMGVYGKEHLTNLASGARRSNAVLPDLQISAKGVNYAPSLPKQGDTLQVRFRMTNAGTADAKQVPIALVLNGKTVASDTFDLKAGASSLGALNWMVSDKAGSGAVNAHVAVDPMHTIVQSSTTAKTAALAHFTLPGSVGVVVASNGKVAHFEVAEGSCVGFRFAAGAAGGCGSADLELSIEDLANGKYILNGRNGVADLGVGRSDASNASYGMQALVVTGHTYAVQLSGKTVGLFTVQRVRSPRQLSEKSDRTFGHVKNVPIGKGSGATQTGDVSGGSGKRSEAFVYFDVQYATQ